MLGKLSKPVFSGRFLCFETQTCYLLPKLRDRTVVRNLKNCDKIQDGWAGTTGVFVLYDAVWHTLPRQTVVLSWPEQCCGNVTVRGQTHWDHSRAPSEPGVPEHCTLPSAMAGKLCCLFGRIHHLSDPSSSCLSCTVVSHVLIPPQILKETRNQAGKTKRAHMCQLFKDHSTHKKERKEEAGLFPWRAGIRGAQGRSQIHHLFSHV